MLGHLPGNASAGVSPSGPKVLCAVSSSFISGFWIKDCSVDGDVVAAAAWFLFRSFPISLSLRGLVPETLREAPSSSLAHRLGLSHFSCLALSFFGLHSHLLCCRKLISPMCWLW